MKLTTLVFSAFAGLSALGVTVTSSNVLGAMKVTCDTQKAIICTPWVSAVAAGDVKLTDLVMTAGLEDGDAVILYANGGFKAWTLSGGAWVGTAVADVGGTTTAGTNEAIARGLGFWFVKKNFSAAYDLYLYGQQATAGATATIAANAWNLIANPGTAAADLLANNRMANLTAAANDQIQIPNGANPPITYKFNGTAWTTTTKTELKNGRTLVTTSAASSIMLPAGKGCWYVSKGGSGSIAW